jgi:hypothetical protein
MIGGNAALLPSRTFTISSLPPALVTRDEPTATSGPPRRTKLWEFNTNLHCSIIGTCLSAAELRQLLKKVGLAPSDSSDHDLHSAAVSLAERHDKAAKLLNKALDERHREDALSASQEAPASPNGGNDAASEPAPDWIRGCLDARLAGGGCRQARPGGDDGGRHQRALLAVPGG